MPVFCWGRRRIIPRREHSGAIVQHKLSSLILQDINYRDLKKINLKSSSFIQEKSNWWPHNTQFYDQFTKNYQFESWHQSESETAWPWAKQSKLDFEIISYHFVLLIIQIFAAEKHWILLIFPLFYLIQRDSVQVLNILLYFIKKIQINIEIFMYSNKNIIDNFLRI